MSGHYTVAHSAAALQRTHAEFAKQVYETMRQKMQKVGELEHSIGEKHLRKAAGILGRVCTTPADAHHFGLLLMLWNVMYSMRPRRDRPDPPQSSPERSDRSGINAIDGGGDGGWTERDVIYVANFFGVYPQPKSIGDGDGDPSTPSATHHAFKYLFRNHESFRRWFKLAEDGVVKLADGAVLPVRATLSAQEKYKMTSKLKGWIVPYDEMFDDVAGLRAATVWASSDYVRAWRMLNAGFEPGLTFLLRDHPCYGHWGLRAGTLDSVPTVDSLLYRVNRVYKCAWCGDDNIPIAPNLPLDVLPSALTGPAAAADADACDNGAGDDCGSTSKFKLCSRCYRVRYCSPERQRAHWQNGHREECEPAPARERKPRRATKRSGDTEPAAAKCSGNA